MNVSVICTLRYYRLIYFDGYICDGFRMKMTFSEMHSVYFFVIITVFDIKEVQMVKIKKKTSGYLEGIQNIYFSFKFFFMQSFFLLWIV